jgi:soluble P-type ATPase
MARRPIIMPRETRIATDTGNATEAHRSLLQQLVDRQAEHVTLTGTAATDIAALRQALIDAGLMKGS